jgi:hypothetical protein
VSVHGNPRKGIHAHLLKVIEELVLKGTQGIGS